MHASQTPFILFNRKDGWPNRIYQCIQIIQRLIEQTPAYYELELNIQLITIWKCLLQNRFQLTYDARKHDRNERMKHMLNWIHEHYHEKVLLQDIAREGQLSRSECCRYFNDILKKSPIHYVNEYRIQQSLILLQKTDLNITEIAYQVGFSGTSYFINIFKRVKIQHLYHIENQRRRLHPTETPSWKGYRINDGALAKKDSFIVLLHVSESS